MKLPIENYTPQIIVEKQKRQAFFAWGAVFLIAFVWFLLVVSAPIAKIYGFNEYAGSIYWFFGHLCHQISDRSYHIHDYQFAVCARCSGFYGGFLLGITIYPLIRDLSNTDSLPRIWLFLAMVPMGIDWSLGYFEIWENTHLSRTITGGILGLACAFFIIPALVEISYFIGEKLHKSG
jgi:uncharacterized membrane protein